MSLLNMMRINVSQIKDILKKDNISVSSLKTGTRFNSTVGVKISLTMFTNKKVCPNLEKISELRKENLNKAIIMLLILIIEFIPSHSNMIGIRPGYSTASKNIGNIINKNWWYE